MLSSQAIEEALKSKDLEALKRLVTLKTRTQNTSENYNTPLMLSAHQLKHLNKIPKLQTDAIILNLEDGVSKEMKPFALELVKMTLSTLTQCDKKIIVRVNTLDEGGDKEIEALNAFKPDAIRVPKIKNREDVQKVLELCDETIEVHLSIETKEAWLNLSTLKVNHRVKAFYLGLLDLLADMKLPQELINVHNPLIYQILAQFLLTAKALGVKPISSVFQEYQDHKGFQEWLDLESQMGFKAKGCLSPQQVQQAKNMFIPKEDDIVRARYIVKEFELQEAKGITGFSDAKYGFIDEPVYKGALALLKG